MSRPREPWWGYIRNILREYPRYEKELDMLRSTKITTSYTAGRRSAEASRTTEKVATRQLRPQDQRHYDAISRALFVTQRLTNGQWRVKMIDLMYFRKSHEMQGAALECHISYATARQWHAEFVRLVASELGLY